MKKKERKVDNCFSQVKALQDRDTHPVSHVIIDLDGVILSKYFRNITYFKDLHRFIVTDVKAN